MSNIKESYVYVESKTQDQTCIGIKGGKFAGVIYKLEAGDFIVFDPRVPHKAEDIMTDKKRIAIDWTIRNG